MFEKLLSTTLGKIVFIIFMLALLMKGATLLVILGIPEKMALYISYTVFTEIISNLLYIIFVKEKYPEEKFDRLLILGMIFVAVFIIILFLLTS